MTYPPHCQYFSRRTHKPLTCVVPVFGRSGPRSAFVPSRSDASLFFLWPKRGAVVCGCRFRWVDHCWLLVGSEATTAPLVVLEFLSLSCFELFWSIVAQVSVAGRRLHPRVPTPFVFCHRARSLGLEPLDAELRIAALVSAAGRGVKR